MEMRYEEVARHSLAHRVRGVGDEINVLCRQPTSWIAANGREMQPDRDSAGDRDPRRLYVGEPAGASSLREALDSSPTLSAAKRPKRAPLPRTLVKWRSHLEVTSWGEKGVG